MELIVYDNFIDKENMMYHYIGMDAVFTYSNDHFDLYDAVTISYNRLFKIVEEEIRRKNNNQSFHLPIFYSNDVFQSQIDPLSESLRTRYSLVLISIFEDEYDSLYGIRIKNILEGSEYILSSASPDEELSYHFVK